jgi:hypothetical protein
MVKSGQKLTINATGKVVLQSLSGNTYYPNGSTTSSNEEDDVEDNVDDGGSTYPAYGNVVFKIGDSGETLKAGAKFSGSAKTSGMLFLSIYETIYNSANTGFYTVTVKVD